MTCISPAGPRLFDSGPCFLVFLISSIIHFTHFLPLCCPATDGIGNGPPAAMSMAAPNDSLPYPLMVCREGRSFHHPLLQPWSCSEPLLLLPFCTSCSKPLLLPFVRSCVLHLCSSCSEPSLLPSIRSCRNCSEPSLLLPIWSCSEPSLLTHNSSRS